MSRNFILLLAGILVAWAATSLITKNFDGTFLIPFLLGVFLGYRVKKKETED